MADGVFVTIVNMEKYYGLKPFTIGNIIKLVKETGIGSMQNGGQRIFTELPYIGLVGEVADSPQNVAGGTLSAGRLYDRFDEVCFAEVCFTTKDAVIAKIVPGAHLHILFAFDTNEESFSDIAQQIFGE